MVKKGNEVVFEEAINELERIVEALEEGDLTLDGALEAFEKGIGLARICASQLDEAERKIDLLLKGKDGNITLKAIDNDDFFGEK